MHSKGTVRKVIDLPDGGFEVSFTTHDGYFTVSGSQPELVEKILASKQKSVEISFTFDAQLHILDVA